MKTLGLLCCLFFSLFIRQDSSANAVNICSATVSVFPYAESFENGAANWFSGGSSSDWVLGSPSKPIINSAGDGISCWVTGGLTASTYNPGQRSWLQSPCFDFTGLSQPKISFQIFWETEYQFDGGNLQYSTDNGTTWQTLGTAVQDACISTNWYNINAITNLSGLASPSCGWSGTINPTSGSCRGGNGSNGWVTASFCLPQLSGSPSVTFRFTFGSGTTCNDFDGIAVDLFQVGESAPRVTTVSYACQSARTVVFTDDQPDCRTVRSWNFGDGTVETNSAPVISHTFGQEGTYTVTLTAEHACLGTEITVLDISMLSFNAEITPVSCSGPADGTILIQPLPAGLPNQQIDWEQNGLTGYLLTGLSPGQYAFQLMANRACELTDTVIMPDRPSAPVPDLGPDRTFCPGSAAPLTASGDYVYYLWSDGSNGPSVIPEEEGPYWVSVRTSEGCEAADTVDLSIECLSAPFFPTAFTPNQDLLNDEFRIYTGSAELQAWYIYDRWGHILFSASEDMTVWSADDVPEGVYTCLVRYFDASGTLLEKVGRVTLLR